MSPKAMEPTMAETNNDGTTNLETTKGRGVSHRTDTSPPREAASFRLRGS